MDERVVTEILAAHADRLAEGGEVNKESYLALFPAYREQLDPLLTLAERIKKTAKPAPLSSEFRANLHQGLLTAAEWQAAKRSSESSTSQLREMLDFEPPWPFRRMALVGGAIIGSFISVAGIVTYYTRSRSTGESHPLASA